MRALLSSYMDILVTQTNWSWAIVTLIYLIVAIWIRGLFLRPIIKKAKTVDRRHYHELKKVYLRKSLLGWLLFIGSLILVAYLWLICPVCCLGRREMLIILVVIALLSLSIMQHLSALGIASIAALKSATGNKEDL